jgi:tetratricopeptide (TPR) repeat protein
MRQRSLAMKLFPAMIVIAALLGAQPRSFGQQPSADAFRKLLSQASEKSQAQEWAAAIPLWEQVVALNPHVARFWYALGTAQINAREYRKAIPSLERAFDLGARSLWLIAFEIARAHARLSEKDAALKWLERSIALGFRNRDVIRNEQAFGFLREDAHFKALAGVVDTAGMSRVEGWRYDVSLVETEIKRMHYYPFR